MASTSASTSSPAASTDSPFPLPRVTIRFCTQCKWMLRAAYFAQELLSTFSTALGEVALQPSTGGTFTVEISYAQPSSSSNPSSSLPTLPPNPTPTIQHRVLWDRNLDGGFPETKELKRRVRDVIEPGRDLGHVDRDYSASSSSAPKRTRVESASQTTAAALAEITTAVAGLEPRQPPTADNENATMSGTEPQNQTTEAEGSAAAAPKPKKQRKPRQPGAAAQKNAREPDPKSWDQAVIAAIVTALETPLPRGKKKPLDPSESECEDCE